MLPRRMSSVPALLCVVHVAMGMALPHSYGSVDWEQHKSRDSVDIMDLKIQLLESLVSQLEHDLDQHDAPPETDGKPLMMTSVGSTDNEALGGSPYFKPGDFPEAAKRQGLSSALASLDASIVRKSRRDSMTKGLDGYQFKTMVSPQDARDALGLTKRGHNPYRYSPRRGCDYSRLTTEHILEYLRSGLLCGKRVSNVRFGLSGRK